MLELAGIPAEDLILPIFFADAEVMALNNFTAPKHTSQMAFPWQHYYNSPIGIYFVATFNNIAYDC